MHIASVSNRMYRFLTLMMFLSCIAAVTALYGQEADSAGSSRSSGLPPVEVMAYFSRQPVLGLTAAAQTLSSGTIAAQQTTTLLPAIKCVWKNVPPAATGWPCAAAWSVPPSGSAM
ncbi:MAG: hypothetical protein KL787_10905 [Taibaiella sp.]|nr:hypothetical protein [Taibaiella sp.]